MSRFQSIEDVWNYLDSIPMFSNVGHKASNFGLESIIRFCEEISNPQSRFKSIHVAGTNGKGSTCYLLEAVYNKAGYKTGMFTSPHLIKYNERIRISGVEVEDQTILEFFQEHDSVLVKIQLTYFEISTTLAFWVFAKENVDIAIIETGLGGRLDSTNIIHPELSIITSIGKDHELVLGNSIEKIASEKAGIIKTSIPVIVGNLDQVSMNIVKDVAIRNNSQLVSSSSLNPVFDKGIISFKDTHHSFKTNLIEPINAWNVAMVYQAVMILYDKFRVSKSTFKDVLECFIGVPARFEKVHPTKKWYFSGSHNEQAIDAMLEAVIPISSTKKVLILSMMKDKVNHQILSKFKAFDKIYFYEQDGERSAKYTDVQKFITANLVDENNHKMILNELKTELVIFAGSFYFYSTIKRWLSEYIKKS